MLLIKLDPPRAAPEAVGAGVLQFEGRPRLEQVAHVWLLTRLGELRVQHKARPDLAEPRARKAVKAPFRADARVPPVLGFAYAVDAAEV